MNPNAEVIHGGLPRKTDDNNIVVGEVPETETATSALPVAPS